MLLRPTFASADELTANGNLQISRALAWAFGSYLSVRREMGLILAQNYAMDWPFEAMNKLIVNDFSLLSIKIVLIISVSRTKIILSNVTVFTTPSDWKEECAVENSSCLNFLPSPKFAFLTSSEYLALYSRTSLIRQLPVRVHVVSCTYLITTGQQNGKNWKIMTQINIFLKRLRQVFDGFHVFYCAGFPEVRHRKGVSSENPIDKSIFWTWDNVASSIQFHVFAPQIS